MSNQWISHLPEKYHLSFSELRGCDSNTATFGEMLSEYACIDSQSSFNRICRQACLLWGQCFSGGRNEVAEDYRKLAERLRAGGEGVIHTPWGGVVVERYEHPEVEKFLVIRKGGYLALETHSQKQENLDIREGAGLLLAGEVGSDQLSCYPLNPGMTFHFDPGAVHCIIGTEDLLVYERSMDPLGMDQDLIFIYTPE